MSWWLRRVTQRPRTGPFSESFKLAHSAGIELDSRSGDKVLDSARHEYLAWCRLRSYASADVDGDPTDLSVNELAFAGVQTRAHLQPELLQRLANCTAAPDRPGRTVEAREEPVSRRIHFRTAVPHELLSHKLVVSGE
jgi:hypothetical protein